MTKRDDCFRLDLIIDVRYLDAVIRTTYTLDTFFTYIINRFLSSTWSTNELAVRLLFPEAARYRPGFAIYWHCRQDDVRLGLS